MSIEIMQKARKEVETELGDELPTEKNLGKLKYCKQILEETLRLKSPVPDLSRFSLEDCKLVENEWVLTFTGKLCGHEIPKGTAITAYFGASHIDKKIWNNPNEFNPDRFSGIRRFFFENL